MSIPSPAEQFFKIQLKWASDNFDAEHRMRLAAEAHAADARELLLDMAKTLLSAELDAVQKKENYQRWTDGELMQWMKEQLGRYLFQLRALTGDAARRRLEQAAQEITRLKAENAQLDQHVHDLQAAARHAPAYQATIEQLRQQNVRLQQALADCQADIEVARSQAARPASAQSPMIIDMPVAQEPIVPSSSTTSRASTPEWYSSWQQTTPPDLLARQQRLIQIVGDGEAFFRSEIVEILNTAGLLREDHDRPGWAAKRPFTSLSELGLIEEIDGGYGASVPKAVTLTARGVSAYEHLTSRALPRTPWARLLDRHKTPEHTVLNLLARNVLRRFGYNSIDLFPEPCHTSTGAVVKPDLSAVSPQGEHLLIECERLAKHRTADERRDKWGDLAALTNGQFHVIVPGGQQQRELITDISQWIVETGTKHVNLSVCQYLKAMRPEAVSPWTYTTTWHLT